MQASGGVRLFFGLSYKSHLDEPRALNSSREDVFEESMGLQWQCESWEAEIEVLRFRV